VGVAITPDGAFAYVANGVSNNVSVIHLASNTVTATVTVGIGPIGVAITP
jgi:YVTN family beta-propeller protein